MLRPLINLLVDGCTHTRTTFPLTPIRRRGGVSTGQGDGKIETQMYVVCLSCGKEFEYRWGPMKVGKPVRVMAQVQEVRE